MRPLILIIPIFLSALVLGEWLGQASTIEPETFGATTEQQIAAAQEAYFAKTGKYLQILEGARLPSYETGDISKLEYTPPADYAVDVYGPNGSRGYVIRKVLPETSDFVTSTTTLEEL